MHTFGLYIFSDLPQPPEAIESIQRIIHSFELWKTRATEIVYLPGNKNQFNEMGK